MWVHLLRHGIAIDPTDPACPTDPERYLTDKGKTRARLGARGLKALGIAPEIVIASPYVRAQQTAEITCEELDGAEQITSELLVPMADPSRILELMRTRTEQNILCVGHAPNLDRVAALLVGADEPVTSLKKAGCASIEMRHGRIGAGLGVLVGVYPASALRLLGGGED